EKAFNKKEVDISRKPIEIVLKSKKKENENGSNDESEETSNNVSNSNSLSREDVQSSAMFMDFRNINKVVHIISTYDSDFIKFSELREYMPENIFNEIDFCLNSDHEDE